MRLFIALVMFWLATGICHANGSLRNAKKPLLWSGSVTRAGGPLQEVPECAPGCQRYELTLDLPKNVWKNKPGGLQIAIRWHGLTSAMPPDANFSRAAAASRQTLDTSRANDQSDNLGDNLKLYVYRGNSLVAASDGSTSLAQSVVLDEAANGTFHIYVVYDPDSPSNQIAYEGLAEVEYRPRVKPVRPLLPDLEARSQRHVTFNPGPIFAAAISPAFPSCYYTEVEEEGARTCLRFDQVFANVGAGSLEVRFRVPRGSTGATHPAYQRIYWSDEPHFEDRKTSDVEFHREHAHYHVMTFALSRLWSTTETAPKRKRPSGLKLVRTGPKVSFCMVDTEIDAWAKKGDGPRKWKAPDCNFPVAKDANGEVYAQGVTEGWKDVYEWYLPHQYIDVSGLPDGVYILETIADPDNRLTESNESNNCGTVYVQLTGMTSGSPAASILNAGPTCKDLRAR